MGMYYLQSRYYDPNTGRFINADDTDYLNATGTVLGCNLFAYCENDPVNRVDPSGCYSASNAVAYAKKWTSGVNNQPKAKFHNQLYQFFPNGDCMNFVSQCLSAGGLAMNSSWYSYRYSIRILGKWRYYYSISDAWCKVSSFNSYFYNSMKWSRRTTFWQSLNTSSSDARKTFLRYADLVTLGAVILMDFKFDGKTSYTHAAIVVGVTLNDIKYAAHTSNRWWQSLWRKVEAKEIERYVIYNVSPYAI